MHACWWLCWSPLLLAIHCFQSADQVGLLEVTTIAYYEECVNRSASTAEAKVTFGSVYAILAVLARMLLDRRTISYYSLVFSYTMQIYNNGYVSLGAGTTGGYSPRPFPFRGAPMIAPYWADVDTKVGSGRVYYRNSASSTERRRAGLLISSAYRTSFRPTNLYIVTWYRVGAYYRSTNPVSVVCMFILQSCMRTSLCSFMLTANCIHDLEHQLLQCAAA